VYSGHRDTLSIDFNAPYEFVLVQQPNNVFKFVSVFQNCDYGRRNCNPYGAWGTGLILTSSMYSDGIVGLKAESGGFYRILSGYQEVSCCDQLTVGAERNPHKYSSPYWSEFSWCLLQTGIRGKVLVDPLSYQTIWPNVLETFDAGSESTHRETQRIPEKTMTDAVRMLFRSSSKMPFLARFAGGGSNNFVKSNIIWSNCGIRRLVVNQSGTFLMEKAE
jgi:hypothetical protein